MYICILKHNSVVGVSSLQSWDCELNFQTQLCVVLFRKTVYFNFQFQSAVEMSYNITGVEPLAFSLDGSLLQITSPRLVLWKETFLVQLYGHLWLEGAFFLMTYKNYVIVKTGSSLFYCSVYYQNMKATFTNAHGKRGLDRKL